MRGRTSYDLQGLLELGALTDPAARRASFRQSLASVARAATEPGPGLLDGLRPDRLQRSVRVALDDRLIDDLDWLSAPAAALALYELAAALPACEERRDVGRRALKAVHGGNAATFAAVATRMALESKKALGGHAMRARIGLCLELGAAAPVAVEPLALALAARRENAREWVAVPSTGALPSRRLAARLLERAAAGAVRRANEGDEHAARLLRGELVRNAWERLLSDREPLVWRHVAVARGLLAATDEALGNEIRAGITLAQTPTEWRRAAVSVAASIAVLPEAGIRASAELLQSALCLRDPGIPATMLWALPRVVEADPDAAAALVDLVAPRVTLDGAENLAGLRRELAGTPVLDRAIAKVLAAPAVMRALEGSATETTGDRALREEILRELRGDGADLRARVAASLAAFVDEGAARAYRLARTALADAQGRLVRLRELDVPGDAEPDDRAARAQAYALVRELDGVLLEQATLRDLLVLGRAPSGDDGPVPELEMVYEDLAQWLSTREQVPIVRGQEVPERTLRQLRIRTLLHLVDAGSRRPDEEGDRAAHLRDRWLRASRIFLDRLVDDPTSSIRRMLCAGLARALDALCRSGMCEPADVTLVAGLRLGAREIETLAEASMHPGLVTALGTWAKFVRKVEGETEGDDEVLVAWTEGLAELAFTLADDASGRTELLRASLNRMARAVEVIADAPSLRDLADPQTEELTALVQVDRELAVLAQLIAGACHRLPGLAAESTAPSLTIEPLILAVERSLRGGLHQLDVPVEEARHTVDAELPSAIAEVVGQALARLVRLEVQTSEAPPPPVAPASTAMPEWLPATRTLGAFFVVRPLGSGGVGSVFLARRAEERNDPDAEHFALKVPDYDGTAARSLSEEEFNARFRREAGALLELPAHPHLAGFVTFDLAARPKPILVMEFIEGTTLERLLAAGSMTTVQALDLLDGVLAGLEAMHSAGLGHLDVKPANVVVRQSGAPVLVDFGLTGRNLRPGCLTGAYGAPEAWGVAPEGHEPGPFPADIYAMGCTLYEALTGGTLFQAPTEVALIGLHLSHDGNPTPVAELARDERLGSLARLLGRCLRRDPRERLTAKELRAALSALRPELSRLSWPIAARAAA